MNVGKFWHTINILELSKYELTDNFLSSMNCPKTFIDRLRDMPDRLRDIPGRQWQKVQLDR